MRVRAGAERRRRATVSKRSEGVRESADANSEHAGSYMLLYPVCQEKNTVMDIFSRRAAMPSSLVRVSSALPACLRGRHCEERSDKAIHRAASRWIAAERLSKGLRSQ